MQEMIEQQIIDRYRTAVNAWNRNEFVQDLGKALGMSKEEYCHSYVEINFRPLTFTSTTSNPIEIDYNHCYQVANGEKIMPIDDNQLGDVYDNGYNAGEAEGYQKGYHDGYEEGKDDGYDNGYEDGRDEGYDDGYELGREEVYLQKNYDIEIFLKAIYEQVDKMELNNDHWRMWQSIKREIL